MGALLSIKIILLFTMYSITQLDQITIVSEKVKKIVKGISITICILLIIIVEYLIWCGIELLTKI